MLKFKILIFAQEIFFAPIVSAFKWQFYVFHWALLCFWSVILEFRTFDVLPYAKSAIIFQLLNSEKRKNFATDKVHSTTHKYCIIFGTTLSMVIINLGRLCSFNV